MLCSSAGIATISCVDAQEPLELAIREIGETRHLLEDVIVSSERFNYIRAKKALQELERKLRRLERIQSRFETKRLGFIPNLRIVDFSKSSQPREQSDQINP